MNILAECTVPEKILLAAYQLEESGETPFSAETLIVTAWKKYPLTFGLKHFADHYPDSNKVLASIMGERGLAKRGWLAKLGQKQYSLTREGRQVVRRLLQADEQNNATIALDRDQERFLQALFAGTAFIKFQEDRKQELTFADACRFWGLTENLRGEHLDERLMHMQLTLTNLDRRLGMGQATMSNGRSIGGGEVSKLGELHSYLETRFQRHLNLLRNRSERNETASRSS